MFPRLRLKTKLVLAISGMVVAVVATLSFLYVSRLVQNRMDEAYQTGDFVAHQVFHATRQALEADLNAVRNKDARLKSDAPAAILMLSSRVCPVRKCLALVRCCRQSSPTRS